MAIAAIAAFLVIGVSVGIVIGYFTLRKLFKLLGE